MKRFLCLCLAMLLLVVPVRAEPIKWVDFQIPYESLKYAMDVDIRTFDQEKRMLPPSTCLPGSGKCSRLWPRSIPNKQGPLPRR